MIEVPEFLSHRPVVNGLVVPYVAVWDAEATGDAALQVWQGIAWVFTENQTGVPLFGSTNSHRQRNGMRKNYCQVCGNPGATLWVIPDDSKLGGPHVRLYDSEQREVINAPLHPECYAYSKEACPHLHDVEPFAMFTAGRLDITSYTISGGMVVPFPVNVGHVGRELIVRAP